MVIVTSKTGEPVECATPDGTNQITPFQPADVRGILNQFLEERTTVLTFDPDDYRSQYGNRGDRWTQLVLPILKQLGAEQVMRRSGRKKSAVYEVLAGKTRSEGAPAARYRDIAVEEGRSRLLSHGKRAPRHPYGTLYRAIRMMESETFGGH